MVFLSTLPRWTARQSLRVGPHRHVPLALRASPPTRNGGPAAVAYPLSLTYALRFQGGSGGGPSGFVGSASIPQGLEMRRGHHLQSSVGLHSPMTTACGREFSPQIYYEMLQACCDPQWLSAIQRELRCDTEYVDHLRQHGGAARDMRLLTDGVRHDDEFMIKLQERLKTDKTMSLTLCAVQESYLRIRQKRDAHETQVAADGGNDPYATMKRTQQAQFGQKQYRPGNT